MVWRKLELEMGREKAAQTAAMAGALDRPEVVTFNGYCPLVASPACVLRGLLAVWNCETETNVGRTWNWISATFCWSDREFRVPEERDEKALSVGAKRVIPELELLSWVLIWSPTWVIFKRRINVVNCPAFSSTFVTLRGPAGAGAGAVVGD